jgi:hypothetical protein
VGKVMTLIGWVIIVFLGVLTFIVATGISRFESNALRGWIVIAAGIPTGVALVVAGKTVRREGPFWRAKRLRELQARDEEWRQERKKDLFS